MYPQFNYVYCANQFERYKMSYTSWGNPETCDKTLLCVHSLNRNGRDFDFIGKHFAKLGYYVVAPDIVGRGNSDYLLNPLGYNIPYYVNDILVLINALQLKNIHFLGTSMGGIIGMGIVALPTNPIQKLILNDIGAEVEMAGLMRIAAYTGTSVDFADYTSAKQYIISTSLDFGNLPDHVWEFLCRISLQKNVLARYEIKRDIKLSFNFKAATATPGNLMLWDYWKLVKIPTLVIRGANSDLLSVATIEKMQTTHPNTSYAEIANCGHAPYLYDDSHFSIIGNFLN